MTAGFGWRSDPFTGGRAFHAGLDLRADPGTPVQATAAGEIIFAGWDGEYGLKVRIQHGGGYQTTYCHLKTTRAARGQRVRRGDVIGFVGSSGKSTGPHLHYEVALEGQSRNPMEFIL
jgi:murein DD-endopeptidase MepM/ murein hydrolase activator NlpD